MHHASMAKFSMISRHNRESKNGLIWSYFRINRPENMCSAQNKGLKSPQKRPLQAASPGQRSVLPVLLALFKVLFVVRWFQEVAFNYPNHTHAFSLHWGTETKGKSCFSQFCSQQKRKQPFEECRCPKSCDTKVDVKTRACVLQASSMYMYVVQPPCHKGILSIY